MKNNNVTLLATLAFIFLLTLGIFMLIDLPKRKANNNEVKNGITAEILGEATGPTNSLSPSPFNLNQFVQNSLKNTKETIFHTATEKMTEIENTVVQTINNEVKNLTQSQIEALKLQICKDLGVITVAPTKQP